MKNQNEQQIQPLNQETFNQIAGAFARLQQLGDKSISTGPGDNTQVEKEKLLEYLATEMLARAGEFLGSWQLCHMEYLPALRSLQAILKRAGYHPTVFTPEGPSNPQNN